jgi:adenylate kinase
MLMLHTKPGAKNQGVILLGHASCGKTTQQKRLLKQYHGHPLSVGEMVRFKKETDPIFRMKYGDMISEGKLLPDQVALDLLREQIRQKELQQKSDLGIIAIDGFCRTPGQVKMLPSIVTCVQSLVGFDFKVSLETVMSRAGERKRDDDLKIIYRFKLWEDARSAVLKKMQRKGIEIIPVDGEGSEDEISAFIDGELKAAMKRLLVA